MQETRVYSYEIIVIDNNSKEDISEYIQGLKNVTLIRNEENVGFGSANNVGINKAVGKYILLLNSDTIIIDQAIDNCISYLKTKSKTGLLGCKLLNEDKSIQRSVFFKSTRLDFFIDSNPLLSKLVKNKQHLFDYDMTQKVIGVSGAFMLFDRIVFEKLKPFDPDFFMFSEETDLCRNRVGKLFDIEYFADASVMHLGGKSAPKEIMYYQAMLSYSLSWYKKGKLAYIFFILTSVINLISSFGGYILAGSKGKKDLAILIKGYITISKYLFFDIPKHPRKWGGRPKPLKLKSIN